MNHLPVFVLCLLAFAALALAMERHQESLFGRAFTSGRTRSLRIAGWIALVLALLVIVKAQGWAVGLVSYSGHTSLAAGIVFSALLFYKRRRARH